MEKMSKNTNGMGPDEKSKMDDDKPSFEKVLEILGMPGRYQLTQLSMTFLAKLIVTFIAMSFVFIGYGPPHVCNKVNETSLLIDNGFDPFNYTANVKVVYEKECEITITTSAANESAAEDREERKTIGSSHCLNGRDFYTTGGKPTTYLSDWDLVCEAEGTAELSQTIFVVGQIIGGLLMSQLVDKLGRKPIFIFSTVSVFVLEGLVLVVPSIYAIYGIKFFSGVFYQGVMTSYLVFGLELLVPRHRQIYGVAICYLWFFQLLVIGSLAYLLQDENWRYLQWIIAACGVFCVVYPFVLTESPRWLAANGKKEEALEIIKKACKQNKKDFVKAKEAFEAFVLAEHGSLNNHAPLVPVSEIENEDCRKPVDAEGATESCPDTEVKDTSGVKKYSVLTLFRTKRLFFVTLTALYIWGTCNMTYYGLYMTSSSIAGDRFLNYILMALVEIPSNAAILIMLNRLSRRIVLMTFMALSAISLMTSSIFVTFIDGYKYVSTILFIFGKFSVTSAFNTIFIYTPEIFPTNLRGVGNGFCSSFGRIGSMVAPFLRPLYNRAPWAPGLMFTVMCAIAFFLIPFLPETKDKNLPTNVEDIKQETKMKESSRL